MQFERTNITCFFAYKMKMESKAPKQCNQVLQSIHNNILQIITKRIHISKVTNQNKQVTHSRSRSKKAEIKDRSLSLMYIKYERRPHHMAFKWKTVQKQDGIAIIAYNSISRSRRWQGTIGILHFFHSQQRSYLTKMSTSITERASVKRHKIMREGR